MIPISEAEVDRELVRRGGMRQFMKLAWPIIEPADALVWNWHHDALCDHVQAVIRGELRNVLINVPPGTTKSMTVSVMGSAFAWVERPAYRVLAASHSTTLSHRDSRKVRFLVQSPWYQARWPINLTKEDQGRLENDQSGFRIVVTGGTGERGNLVLVDDLLSARDAESEAHRAAASEFFWETLPTRLNDFRRDGKIVIAQRLHESDPPGEILERAGGDWEQLIIPNEFEPARKFYTSLGWEDPRTEEGELMHPERVDRETTDHMKSGAGIGAHAYAGQFQQRPAPRGGAIVKEEWLARRFRVRGERPRMVVQSWDCASKPKERNDPSAGGTFAVFDDRVEVWHVSAKRQEFPDLVRRVKDLYNADWGQRPAAVLVEDKDAGQQLIQQLKRDTRMPITSCDPEGLDKVTRMATETTFLEAGKLWLPEDEPWVAEFVHELLVFPSGTHDDRVDMLSQFLKWLREKGQVRRAFAPVSVDRSKPSPT